MQKVSRSIFAGLLVIAGLTACGDKVTVSAPNPGSSSTPTSVVHSVTVSPSSVSLKIGETVQLVATVDADAGLARTVTWKSGDSNKATVSSSGLVSAVSSGTVVITATSTADATVAGAATIIVAPVTAASISIASISQNGVPANLTNVQGQLDVTLNVDQGTQTVTELDLIVHNNAANTDTTVAKYMFTSANKAAGSKSSAPITMSFNTAAFTDSTGKVAFVNGAYSIKAQAVIAGSSGQAPVSSTMAYTVNNTDVIGLKVTATHTGSDAGGLQWIGGTVTYNVVPVLYSGLTLKSATLTPWGGAPLAVDANQAAVVDTTFPGVATFQGTAANGDLATYSPFQAKVAAVYSNGQAFDNGVNDANIVSLTGSLVAPYRADWQAPAAPATFAMTRNGNATHWINGSYTFGNSTDYKLVAAPGDDPGAPSTPGSGAMASSAQFWAFPKASFTALGAVSKTGSACKTTGATQVTAASGLAQSAAADSTTYYLRVLQPDNVGNIVCQDLGAATPASFGVDLTAPVNAKYSATSGQNSGGLANTQLGGTYMAYNNAEFTNFSASAVDSISGFDNVVGPVTVTSTVLATNGQTTCALAGAPTPCTQITPFAFASTVWANANTEGYYTVSATVSDRAGNSVNLPTNSSLVIDRTPPTGSGGVAIPAALVGGQAVSLTGSVTDNLTLMSGEGSVVYAPITIYYGGSLSSAGTFGSLNKAATATVNIPWFITALQAMDVNNAPNNASAGPTAINIRGVDEVGLGGGVQLAPIPPANITTTGADWTTANFNTFTVSAPSAATNISIGTGNNARSVALAANVNLPSSVALPFPQVCWFYADTHAVTTNATPTFQTEYKLIGCQSAAATSDNANWVYSYGSWTPPASLGVGANVSVVAIGYGSGGHAALTNANTYITLTN